MRKPAGYWTKERCQNEARLYNDRMSFVKGSNNAYDAARRNKWLDDITSHFPICKLPNGYWTIDRCREEAIKYTNRRDFRKYSSKAYWAAKNKSILDDICFHMQPLGNKYKRFVYEIRSICGNYIYIGLSINPKRRFNQHSVSGPCVEIIKKGAQLTIISELLNAEDARNLERDLISYYSNTDFKLLNSASGGSLGWGTKKHSVESVSTFALKCATRVEFARTYTNEYAAARRNGWLDVVCAHMVRGTKR